MYDGILRLKLPANATIVGFADNIALVITASSLEQAALLADASIGEVKLWLMSMGLTLADHKTEAVLITSRKGVLNN